MQTASLRRAESRKAARRSSSHEAPRSRTVVASRKALALLGAIAGATRGLPEDGDDLILGLFALNRVSVARLQHRHRGSAP